MGRGLLPYQVASSSIEPFGHSRHGPKLGGGACALFVAIGWSTWWRGGATGEAFGFAISRSRVQITLEAALRNNLSQVVYTYVPLSPSSITWYRPKVGDALRLGR